MVRFAHIADVHLGGWKQEPLQQLNLESFKQAIDICIKERVDFVLIAGDLFDSAYPPIEILKEAFAVFRKLNNSRIPCFIIAGSHDYSVSGKTFLDVLEKAGFCTNLEKFELKEETIILNPTVFGEVALYGYPGKKSGLEIPDLRKVKINDSPGLFKIFALHTTLDKAKGTLPIDSIEASVLPYADYYALGHLHIDFQYRNFIYPGPLFPNNFQELEDLNYGSFYIVDTKERLSMPKKYEIKIKQVLGFDIKVHDALFATEQIINELNKKDLTDKIILLRISGLLEKGKASDIKFTQIEEYVKSKGAYFLLKNTHELEVKEEEMEINVKDSENVQEETINIYSQQNPSDFNSLITQLMESLSLEKQEGEKNEVFETRLKNEIKKVLKF